MGLFNRNKPETDKNILNKAHDLLVSEKYEKAIGLKTIWLTFVRRWKVVLVVFVAQVVKISGWVVTWLLIS